VIALSAKADSFSDQNGIALEVCWPRPSQESACEDIPCGVLVSVQRQPTMWTGVPAFGQSLGHDVATSAAFLGCSARIHNHNLSASSFSLAAKDVHEAGPADIGDCASERVVLEHVRHVQVFHTDQPVQPDEKQSNLVMMLMSQIANTSMQNSNLMRCFSSVTTTLLFSRYRALETAQLRKLNLLVTRILYAMMPVASREKCFEPNINSNRWERARWNNFDAKVTRQDHEPLVDFALQRCSLDLALDLTVNFRADCANVLNSQTIAFETNAIAISRKLNTVKMIVSLETRKAFFFCALFAATKKVLVTLVESSQRRLLRGEICACLVWIGGAQFLELPRLCVVIDAQAARLIGKLALFKRDVVKSPVCLDHDIQLACLIDIRVQTKLERSAHLHTFLIFDISLDARFGDGATRTSVITATPQSRQSRTQRREFSSQVMRCATLKTMHQFGYRPRWIRFQKQMHMIGHNFQSVNRGIQLTCDLSQQYNQPLFDLTNKYRPSVLRTPYQMKLQGEDSSSVLGVALMHSLSIYTPATKSTTKGSGLPLPAKAGSPRPVN